MATDVKYEFLEHTADVGLRAHGRTLEEIFENAAVGMFDLMTDVSRVRAKGEVEIHVQSQDIESLLVDWLTELLYVHETENVFLSEFKVAIEDLSLTAAAKGEPLDPSRHPMELLVKAVTYHMIEVNPKEGYATVIFDI
ncbi:MAG: archease [Thermoplasmata archaeon]